MGIEATYSYGVFPYSAAKKVASQVLCSNLKVSLAYTILGDIANREGSITYRTA